MIAELCIPACVYVLSPDVTREELEAHASAWEDDTESSIRICLEHKRTLGIFGREGFPFDDGNVAGGKRLLVTDERADSPATCIEGRMSAWTHSIGEQFWKRAFRCDFVLAQTST